MIRLLLFLTGLLLIGCSTVKPPFVKYSPHDELQSSFRTINPRMTHPKKRRLKLPYYDDYPAALLAHPLVFHAAVQPRLQISKGKDELYQQQLLNLKHSHPQLWTDYQKLLEAPFFYLMAIKHPQQFVCAGCHETNLKASFSEVKQNLLGKLQGIELSPASPTVLHHVLQDHAVFNACYLHGWDRHYDYGYAALTQNDTVVREGFICHNALLGSIKLDITALRLDTTGGTLYVSLATLGQLPYFDERRDQRFELTHHPFVNAFDPLLFAAWIWPTQPINMAAYINTLDPNQSERLSLYRITPKQVHPLDMTDTFEHYARLFKR